MDSLIHHVVHTMKSCDLDNIQAELMQFPEQFALGLQCVCSYQETVKMSSAANKRAGSENSAQDNSHRVWPLQDTLMQQTFTKGQNAVNVVETGSRMGAGRCTNFGSGIRTNPGHHRQNSIGSTGSQNSSNLSGNSESGDNNGSQNRTVTIYRHNMSSAASSHDDTSSAGGSNNTVVLRKKFCSPTELTFFSNKLDNSQNSPVNNCSKSSCGSACSQQNADFDYSISSKLSKESQGDRTFDKSDESKQCEMNINFSESKANEYNQNKVKNKLDGFYSSEQETKKKNVLKSDNYSEKSMGHQVGRAFRGAHMGKFYRDQKRSNSIVRQELPKPTKELNHLKWITLSDDLIGRCILPGLALPIAI